MRVTIIVPVFNKELYVNSVLSNIADQTLADFECLVIDDGSTDMSGKSVMPLQRETAVFKYSIFPTAE